MELRSVARQKREQSEFNDLKNMLCGLGYYEDGMDTKEMRQVVDALQQSESLDEDLGRALRASERDFMLVAEGMANSTMITSPPHFLDQHCVQGMNTTLSDSFDLPAEQFTVFAEVHHPLDWSPPATQSPSVISDSEHFTYVIDSKVQLQHTYGVALQQHSDSGLSMSGSSAASSAVSSIITASSCTPSSSVHSELSQISQDDGNAAELSWDDHRVQASSSSVAVSSDDTNGSFNPPSI